jgi:hypothetical protein
VFAVRLFVIEEDADPLSTMRSCRNMAVEDMYELPGRLINEKIRELDEKPG